MVMPSPRARRIMGSALCGAVVLCGAPAALAQEGPDFGWLNGTNDQPEAPLKAGPVTWSLLIDTYYGYAFNRPSDHTVFPTTTAPRHNEFNLNLGVLGAEVTGLPDTFGKLVLQTGNYVDTVTGTDATVGRGAFSSLVSMRNVQQAYVGQRLTPDLSIKMGLFPAFIGIDSYWPQENWNYTHNLLSDFTPYYLMGGAVEGNLRPDLKAQFWLVNGWQSISQLGEGKGIGWSLNWTPSDRLSLTHNFLGGNFEADQSRTRYYTNHSVQWKYAENPVPGITHMALVAAVDYAYNTAGTQLLATSMGGVALLHRITFSDQWALSLRGSVYSDPQKLVAAAPPLAAGQSLSSDPLTTSEVTATLDFKPSPWLLHRLEVRHDMASIPYIAGPGGVTSTPADFRTSGTRAVFSSTLRF